MHLHLIHAFSGAFLAFRLVLVLGAALSGLVLSAQTAGTLSGRITDAATGLSLAGARVSVTGTNQETYTNAAGEYALDAVPTGAQTVEINYVGYPTLARQVTVNGVTRLDAVFNDEKVQLDKLVIEGAAVGTARAINQQRAAATLRNIVAADEIGNFPDQNAAEALQRVPGVALYRDQGEGRYVIVRGLNYTLNSVTLNGAKLASPESGDRGIALDVIPADALSSVEVSKVSTPDMDAEGLGGQVNIRTKSPFDHDGLAAAFSVEGQYSALTGQLGAKFNGALSTVTADGRLGVLVAPTWQKRRFGSYNFEEDGWSPQVSPTDGKEYYVLEAINFRDYQIERERYGANAALEGRPSADTRWHLRTTYSKFTDHEYRNRSVFDFTEGTLIAADANSATFNKQRRWRRDVRLREKIQDLGAAELGGETRWQDWHLDGQLAWSRGHESNPGEASVRFRHNTRDGSFRYTFDGPYAVTLEQLAGGAIDDPTTYALQRIDYSNDSGNENEFDAGLNARLDLATANPASLKVGALFRGKKKDKEVEAYELTTAPADFTFANLAGGVSDYPYLHVPRVDGDRASQAFYGNFGAFSGARVFEDSELEDWVSHEDVLAAYLMGTTRIGATTLIAGVRVEHTQFDTTGNDLDLANEVVLGRTRTKHDYTNWLPGIYLRHDLGKDVTLRASWSNTLARPAFSESAAYTGINDDDGEVTQGNPGLEALTASNLDASVEYYLPALGVFSAGVFYKQIDNFSYQVSTVGGYAPRPTYRLTTFRNGSDGEIKGLELAFQRQFRNLPAPFDGLGVLANVTFSDSDATYPTRPGEKLPFIGQSRTIGNAGLTYEKAGFFARLALNFRSERLREDEPIGADAYGDRYVDRFSQLDLTTRYRFARQWEVFFDWVNITNEPFRVSFRSPPGQGARLVQFEEYDWSMNLGLRWKL